MATIYEDGEILADSFITGIGGQMFVVNNLNLAIPQVAAERNDEKGVLAAKRSWQDEKRWSGTAELQVQSALHNIALQLEEFVVPSEATFDGVPMACVIEAETGNVVINESRVRSVEIRRDTRLTIFQLESDGSYETELITGELTSGDVTDDYTSVVIGDTVTSLGIIAFAENSLTSVIIPDSVTSIGSYALAYNSLTSVIIPDSVTSIGSHAFRENSLTSVIIPDSVTSIGSYVFSYNSLTSVVIPDSVTDIGSYAFRENSLTSVIIPDSVTSIGNYAFAENSLTSVVIGDSVTSIGSYAFAENSLTSVIIPDSVTSIGDSSFRENSLTSVIIPDSVTSIGSFAFSANANLATVNCYTTKTVIDLAFNAFTGTASPLTIHARSTDATWTAGTGLTIGGNTNVTVIKDL